ncbi:hypothetical protein LGQ02_10345 [Bacillus shivajii]|uniref:hypothetical protein n=1 Tax=Bacillus shivajii TaxID=1983719 RepID=UPI001CFB73C5|nr:hypothetical protein [Bacillus shivajii]UCZ55090.1 hypothetical protein LGQ02_10345 [Bacillus shivajii]
MKKIILIMAFFTLVLILIGCNFIEEYKAKSAARDYYYALIQEDYDQAFEQLYLYDYIEEKHPTEGTSLSDEKAKAFFMEKVEYLNERNYKVLDYEIENIRYEDGHSFVLEILLNVEQDGERVERSEIVDLWQGKVWVIEVDDPFSKYRDGRMNFDIKKELYDKG